MAETKETKLPSVRCTTKMRKREPIHDDYLLRLPDGRPGREGRVDYGPRRRNSMGHGRIPRLRFGRCRFTQDVKMPHVQAVRRGTPNRWVIGDMPSDD